MREEKDGGIVLWATAMIDGGEGVRADKKGGEKNGGAENKGGMIGGEKKKSE